MLLAPFMLGARQLEFLILGCGGVVMKLLLSGGEKMRLAFARLVFPSLAARAAHLSAAFPPSASSPAQSASTAIGPDSALNPSALSEAARLATIAIDSGAALDKLNRFIEFTNR